MRKTYVVFSLALLAFPVACLAQSTSAAQQSEPSGWARVQALHPGTTLKIKGPALSLSCRFASATESDLTCTTGGSSRTVAKAGIFTIKAPHRGRSALVGAGIGAAGGAIAGASTCKGDSFVGPGGCAAILGVPLAVIGAGIGAGTDFTRTLVYSAH